MKIILQCGKNRSLSNDSHETFFRSLFCREELMSGCETHGVDYVLGLAKNEPLKA
jgi:hypothetical protein